MLGEIGMQVVIQLDTTVETGDSFPANAELSL